VYEVSMLYTSASHDSVVEVAATGAAEGPKDLPRAVGCHYAPERSVSLHSLLGSPPLDPWFLTSRTLGPLTKSFTT
jgi:hypothetical protein